MVVIGGGFISAEVAASCRSLGLPVVLIEKSSGPMISALGKEIAQCWAQLHRAHGVDLRVDVGVVCDATGAVENGYDDFDIVEGDPHRWEFVAAYGRAGRTIAVLSTIPGRVYAYRNAISRRAPLPPKPPG